MLALVQVTAISETGTRINDQPLVKIDHPVLTVERRQARALDVQVEIDGRSETYGDRRSLLPDMVIAALATIYTLFLVYVAGWDHLLLSCMLYATGALLHLQARRERGLRVFTRAEGVSSESLSWERMPASCRWPPAPLRSSGTTTHLRSDMTRPSAAYGVHSEVGKLHKVLVCSPGLAHERLTPSNCDDLLFDDVLWVQNARRDHFDFMDKMRDRDVEVVELHNVLTETMEIPEAKAWLLDRKIVAERGGPRPDRRHPGIPRLAGAAQAGRSADRRDVDPRPAGRDDSPATGRWPARTPVSPSI